MAGAKKLGSLPENFAFYMTEWLEDSDIMKLVGAVAIPAKSGKNKGNMILPRGAKRTTTCVTQAEIKEAAERIAAQRGRQHD